MAVGLELGIDAGTVAGALAAFHGADRRFQRLGEAAGVLVIDDYGHHPTEIRAVLDAARASLGRRLIVAFQPHRYSRTARLMDRFGPALAQADELVLADIYAAGEDPIRRRDRRGAGRRHQAGARGPAAPGPHPRRRRRRRGRAGAAG